MQDLLHFETVNILLLHIFARFRKGDDGGKLLCKSRITMRARVVFCLLLALALVAANGAESHRKMIEGNAYFRFSQCT